MDLCIMGDNPNVGARRVTAVTRPATQGDPVAARSAAHTFCSSLIPAFYWTQKTLISRGRRDVSC
jgi:hypothetical protein